MWKKMEGGLMKKKLDKIEYCAICETTEKLREFKSHYICNECIEMIKIKGREIKKLMN